jgi:hypothetical protein
MKPAGHIALSTAIGATVSVATGNPWALATTIGAGVLIDIDHTLDYYNWFIRGRTKRVFYLLHGWEYLVPLLLVTLASAWNALVLGALLGLLSHLIADQVANKAYPLTYFVSYRLRHGFLISRVSPWTVEGSRADLVSALRVIPFGKYLAPLLVRRLESILFKRQAVRRDRGATHAENPKSTAPGR